MDTHEPSKAPRLNTGLTEAEGRGDARGVPPLADGWRYGRETAQPLPVASKASLLQVG
jgi:hypothetical protein